MLPEATEVVIGFPFMYLRSCNPTMKSFGYQSSKL